MSLGSSDLNVTLAVDYIQEFFKDNQLKIIVNNHNSDLILHHLANFIKLSKSSKAHSEATSATKLESISLKFECNLYHKIYKQEILKILLTNAEIVKHHTKL